MKIKKKISPLSLFLLTPLLRPKVRHDNGIFVLFLLEKCEGGFLLLLLSLLLAYNNASIEHLRSGQCEMTGGRSMSPAKESMTALKFSDVNVRKNKGAADR